MKHGYAFLLLPTLLMFVATSVSAATREEIKQLDAIQLPGTKWICRGEAIVQIRTQRLIFKDIARASVISVSGKSRRYRMERVSTLNGAVKSRYTYETTSALTEDAFLDEIDPDTLLISYPEDAKEKARLSRLFRDHVRSRQQFEDISITRFPEWDIAAVPDDPTHMRYHCAPAEHSG